MILLIVDFVDSWKDDGCHKTCFGPATKLTIHNDLSHGNLYVDGNNVKCDGPRDKAVFKISAGRDFYLYDPLAERFICWKRLISQKKRPMRHHKKTLVGKKYRRKLEMEYCKFIDMPIAQGWLKLVPSFNTNLKMMFTANGQPTNKHNKYPRRERFIIDVVQNRTNPVDHCLPCPEAEQYFCDTKLKEMREFTDICKTVKSLTTESTTNVRVL